MVASWVSQASFEPLGLTIAVAKDRAIESMMQVRRVAAGALLQGALLVSQGCLNVKGGLILAGAAPLPAARRLCWRVWADRVLCVLCPACCRLAGALCSTAWVRLMLTPP